MRECSTVKLSDLDDAVEFDEGCFHAVLENVCYKLFEVQDEIQVIGNIYEDEEL